MLGFDAAILSSQNGILQLSHRILRCRIRQLQALRLEYLVHFLTQPMASWMC